MSIFMSNKLLTNKYYIPNEFAHWLSHDLVEKLSKYFV